MAKPAYKPGKKGGFPFGLKTGKGKAPAAAMPAKTAAKGTMPPQFAKKK